MGGGYIFELCFIFYNRIYYLTMIYGITFSDEKMSQSAEVCEKSMKRNGVDTTWRYDPEYWKDVEYDIPETFEWLNSDILSQKRGCGFWLWKPWCIAHQMKDCKDGDILIYADAGVEFIAPISHIIDRMDQDMFLFTNTHPNHHWTKRFTLDTMMPGWSHDRDANTQWPQVQASVIFIKVNQNTRDFIKKWLLWCQMPGIIDDSASPGGELSYFQDHRHDQSVLSILATQAKYRLHWWPTAYAEHIRVEGDTYPVLFNHHRLRDKGKGDGEPEWD